MSKELKRDKLYICDIEYDYELESGIKEIAKEKLIGYVNGTEDFFFLWFYLLQRKQSLLWR